MILSPEERGDIDKRVEELMIEAVEYARASEWPNGSEAFADMYATEYPGLPARGSQWSAN
jgi:TPP-dependent pyruvate/acetoin dehydrogenase alpha subunit